MANNIFISQDPTLTGMNGTQSGVNALEFDRMEQQLAEKLALLQQTRQQVLHQQQAQVQPVKSRTPVWDEIDSIVQGMTDKEYEIVTTNEEWMESNNRILGLIQTAQMQMLRPVIEQSAEGKEALEHHLTLTKRVKKSASVEVDNELRDFKEYKEHFSDMPYTEYLKMKRESKSKKK